MFIKHASLIEESFFNVRGYDIYQHRRVIASAMVAYYVPMEIT